MPIVSHPEADEELVGAALWYEERQPGLGDDFLEAFEHTLRRTGTLAQDPGRKNRKLNLRRFPYPLVYSIGPDAIHLKAVMHLHRRPGYWRHR